MVFNGRRAGSGIALVGAPSSIGIRPYDDSGIPRALDQAPSVLRSLGLKDRPDVEDLGDVVPPSYVDVVRTPGRVRNEAALVQYSRALAERVATARQDGRFVLLLGGDCSIVLGALLGVAREAGDVGLAYIDAHSDFNTPTESVTGSAAGMCLAMAVGRGDTPLAQLGDARPLVRGSDVALIGPRDADDPYGQAALGPAGVLSIDGAEVTTDPAGAAGRALDRIARDDLDGFWIHFDADFMDPSVMPAVDSPTPGGPDIETIRALLIPLVTHPRALGMHVSIYDPGLDPERSAGAALASLLDRVLSARMMEVGA
ncbi:MAG TPA: arginase family protein [Longimicrobiales bacterium]|nr:arginase family protein [Longimicrobiales bacterium]